MGKGHQKEPIKYILDRVGGGGAETEERKRERERDERPQQQHCLVSRTRSVLMAVKSALTLLFTGFVYPL